MSRVYAYDGMEQLTALLFMPFVSMQTKDPAGTYMERTCRGLLSLTSGP
ncbi:hypothetical protein [Paenibacillus tyrfis]|nr:hypothetical protein [Paenibacillus tyrfis]